jgi:diaminohydroxyphosphoribosylaminopyrimidine deaminase / 5-amino-6-(5-phosphoribosylamino)uracil reductase
MSGGKVVEARMKLALESARRGTGKTYPNPSVGAVVWKGTRVLGRGVTRPAGGPHAEVVALRNAIRRHGDRAVRGASMGVTLEPCCFQGRTAPCTGAIIEAGLSRVYVGCRDPHARVSGRGIAKLRRAGIRVEVGIAEAACREHHRGFLAVCERGRPFVTLKLGSTLDGRIATGAGESRWITGAKARGWVHRLRGLSDAVMVGSGTALADDPALTARRGDRVVSRPVRVLVDSRLRVPVTAQLYSEHPGARTLVLTRSGARGRRSVAATGA